MTRIDYRTFSSSRPVVTRVELPRRHVNRYRGSTVNPNSMLRDFVTALIFAVVVAVCIAAAVMSCRASELYEETMVCGHPGLRLPVFGTFDETLSPIMLLKSVDPKSVSWRNCRESFGAEMFAAYKITDVQRSDASTALYLSGFNNAFISLSNSLKAAAQVKPGHLAFVQLVRNERGAATLVAIADPETDKLIFSNSKGREVVKVVEAWAANNGK